MNSKDIQKIINICNTSKNFLDELLAPIEKLTKQGRWFTRLLLLGNKKSFVIIHPLELMSDKSIKVFCITINNDIFIKTKNISIEEFYKFSEITDNDLIAELNSELAKSMLLDNTIN